MARAAQTSISERIEVDIPCDPTQIDDTGMSWAVLDEAAHPARIVESAIVVVGVTRVTVGRMLVAGNSQAVAVVRVVAVDDEGQVHFVVLPGSVGKNRHLFGGASG